MARSFLPCQQIIHQKAQRKEYKGLDRTIRPILRQQQTLPPPQQRPSQCAVTAIRTLTRIRNRPLACTAIRTPILWTVQPPSRVIQRYLPPDKPLNTRGTPTP